MGIKEVPGPERVVRVEVEKPIEVVQVKEVVQQVPGPKEIEKIEGFFSGTLKADLLVSINQLSASFKAASMERKEQHKTLVTELRKCDVKIVELSRFTSDKFSAFEIDFNDRISAFMNTVNQGVVEDL